MSEINTITFRSVKRDGSTKEVSFGDLDRPAFVLPDIAPTDDAETIGAMIALVMDSGLSLDDKINLVHTICHSVKYAGLVKSATI